jgi:hypothetical protein
MGGIPLNQVGRAIAYDAPAHSTHVVQIKRASFMKGEYPAHLKPYAGQIKECPVQCKGKKGLDFRACLMKCAEKVKKKK